MGIRSDIEGFALTDPSLLDNADEFGDGCHMQILSVFPNLVLQQIQNALAVRQVLPKGQMADGAELDDVRLCRRHA
jgi:anthranilate 1,2-dioxygenase large subunit/terephthalate 1,2-dioxygenase oxygenase component alpha subunit